MQVGLGCTGTCLGVWRVGWLLLLLLFLVGVWVGAVVIVVVVLFVGKL